MKENKNNLTDDQVMVPVVVTAKAAHDLGFKKSDIHPWTIGSHTVNVVFVPASKAVRDGYLRTWYNEFQQEDRDARCQIIGESGKMIRCPESNKCAECAKMRDHKTVTFSDLEGDDSEENIPFEDQIPDTGHASYGDEYFAILNNLVDFVSKIHPEYALVVYLLGLEYTQHEVSEMTGISQQLISYWVRKLRVECEDFFDNII